MILRDDEIRKFDDEELETYLKQFQPLKAHPLSHREVVTRTQHSSVSMVLAALFAILLIVGALKLDRHAEPAWNSAETKSLFSEQPPSNLTVGSANLLLEQSSSVGEALNVIARDSLVSLPQGTTSALSALGKENFRL